MSDAIWIALIAALPGLLMTMFTQLQVRRVHVLVNSQKDALTKLLREALAMVETLEQRGRHAEVTIAHLRAQLVGLPAMPVPVLPEEAL